MKKKRTVDGDADEVSDLLDLGPSQFERAKIPEHEVIVCSARLELIPVFDNLIRKRLCVFNHLLRICLPCWLRRLQQRGCDTRDSVVVGSTLTRREHGIIHALLDVLAGLAALAEEDETGAGTTKCFVSESSAYTPRESREIADTYVVVVTTSQYLKGSASS